MAEKRFTLVFFLFELLPRHQQRMMRVDYGEEDRAVSICGQSIGPPVQQRHGRRQKRAGSGVTGSNQQFVAGTVNSVRLSSAVQRPAVYIVQHTINQIQGRRVIAAQVAEAAEARPANQSAPPPVERGATSADFTVSYTDNLACRQAANTRRLTESTHRSAGGWRAVTRSHWWMEK